MRGAALQPPCSCFQSPEIYGEKNDTRTAGLGLLEKGRGGRGRGVVQTPPIQMNNSTMQQPLAFLIQHYHFTMCFYFGILFIYSLFWGEGGELGKGEYCESGRTIKKLETLTGKLI